MKRKRSKVRKTKPKSAKPHVRAVGALGLKQLMERYGPLFVVDQVVRKDFPDFAGRMDDLIRADGRYESMSRDEYERVLDACLALYGNVLIQMVTSDGHPQDASRSIRSLMLLVLLGAHLHEVGLVTLPQMRGSRS